MSDLLQISDLASRSGFSPSALRYYERIGLLEAAERSPSGYRLFGTDTVDRLRFIERAKQLGLPLDEIRELVVVWDAGQCAHVQASLREQITTKSIEVHNRIEELTAFASQLDRAVVDLAAPAPNGACEAGCGCADPRPDATVDTTPAISATPSKAIRKRLAHITEVPVACTLEAGDQPGRLAEWETVLDQVIERTPIPGGIRLFFPPGPDLAGTLANLAFREQACCSFFTFTLRPGAASLELDVTAPDDAQAVIQHLFVDRP